MSSCAERRHGSNKRKKCSLLNKRGFDKSDTLTELIDKFFLLTNARLSRLSSVRKREKDDIYIYIPNRIRTPSVCSTGCCREAYVGERVAAPFSRLRINNQQPNVKQSFHGDISSFQHLIRRDLFGFATNFQTHTHRSVKMAERKGSGYRNHHHTSGLFCVPQPYHMGATNVPRRLLRRSAIRAGEGGQAIRYDHSFQRKVSTTKMATLMEDFEQQYAILSAEITTNISCLSTAGDVEKQKSVRGIERLLDEAHELVSYDPTAVDTLTGRKG